MEITPTIWPIGHRIRSAVDIAKESGLSITTLTVDSSAGNDNVDIRNDVTEFEFSTPRGVYEWTGVDKAAMERGLGLADFSITLKGTFNDAASKSHATLKTVSSTSVERTVALNISGQTLSNEVIFTDYALNRAQNGELTWTAPAVLSNGTAPTWS